MTIVCSCALWLIIVILADTQIVTREHKQAVIRFVTEGVQQVARSTVTTNTGIYSTMSLRYTNAYFYAVLAIHLLFSLRLRPILDQSPVQQALFSFCSRASSFMFNTDFIALLVTHLHIAEESMNSERLYFASLLEHGNDDIRRHCLNRLRSELSYQTANEEFVIWCLPLVCLCVGETESLTALAASILDDVFVNTPYSALVVSALQTSKELIAFLLRLPECREFLFRLIQTDAGFQLCEDHQFVSDTFDEFMVGLGASVHCRKRVFTSTSWIWRT